LTNQPAALKAAIAPQPTTKPAPVQQGAAMNRTVPPTLSVPATQASTGAAPSVGVMDELMAMREMIEERFTTMSWLGQAKQDPIQSNLMLKLIRSGYSPSVVRGVLERMPEGMQATDAIRWVMDVLEHNLATDANIKPIYVQGGIHALVGATGVGKTTTTAKLAAMCVKTYGPQSVGLITLDTYRIAAHEQLRAYGRMLGVVAHLAHDRAALQDLLGLLANKKMVLIDTTGMAPRDPRTKELLDVLDIPKLNRLLVLNAGSHGDTQDEVLNAYKTPGTNSVVLTKLDETVKIGPALDTLIRHQLMLRGVTRGQRVPEDWEQPDAAELVRTSMRSVGKSPQDPKSGEVGLLFANAGAPFKLESLQNA
jgi:flagellar biosynthesis protein FlhF